MEVREGGWRKEDFCLVVEGWVKYQLRGLNTHKSMGLNRIHPWVLRELEDVALQLSITSKNYGELKRCPVTGERPMSFPAPKMVKRILLTSQPLLHPRKGDGANHSEENKVIRSSQYGFPKSKSYSTNFTAFMIARLMMGE